MKSDNKNWNEIIKYVSGGATDKESERVEMWMQSDPLNQEIADELRKIWDLTPQENFSVDVEEAWSKFEERKKALVHSSKAKSVNLESRHLKKYRSKVSYYRTAAMVLMLVLAGLFAYILSMNHSAPEVATEQNGFYTLKRMETDRGEKARVRFSDGTEVMLNSASVLQFPQEFSGNKREVYLEGEAFFKVSYDPEKPFFVHVQDAIIEVLGTEFNIRGWENEPDVKVVVSDGKVSVNSTSQNLRNSDGVILTKGTKTNVYRGKEPSTPEKIDTIYYLLWTSGGIYFNNTPFHEVTLELERRFDVDITILDRELSDIPFTGTFQYADLNEILTVISASIGIDYYKEGINIGFYISE